MLHFPFQAERQSLSSIISSLEQRRAQLVESRSKLETQLKSADDTLSASNDRLKELKKERDEIVREEKNNECVSNGSSSLVRGGVHKFCCFHDLALPYQKCQADCQGVSCVFLSRVFWANRHPFFQIQNTFVFSKMFFSKAKWET